MDVDVAFGEASGKQPRNNHWTMREAMGRARVRRRPETGLHFGATCRVTHPEAPKALNPRMALYDPDRQPCEKKRMAAEFRYVGFLDGQGLKLLWHLVVLRLVNVQKGWQMLSLVVL